ncbi:hypothetical protein PCASD_03530 [Puccinia coronata f. sp. avenae]|uniref:Uncharacterized protein n=1 Tax=Puccinia coronata f. sp. avenae TaxID=200324 RepID=A0A2N5V7L8_9BASI|nr:hypothetical protein PCASD_03530 [Puccinia coronata f. sp. avenae]
MTFKLINTGLLYQWDVSDSNTAGINRSNTAVQAVLKQPSVVGWALSDRSESQLVGQICPTGLSDPPAGALVGQCLSDHRSNTAV